MNSNTVFLSILVIICLLGCHTLALDTYIVHVELPDINTNQLSNTSPLDDLESWYRSFLPVTIAASGESANIVYSYRNVFIGFAARLSPEHVKAMEKIPGFVSARPEEFYSLHTTHSPNFLGLHQNIGLWNQSNYGKGVIIGVFDTGIRPDHPSFNDEGMPPPPAKWKGACQFNWTTCNNKLIGARSFGYDSPVDDDGHGTHTASTAAGNYVNGANVFGNANGTAVGIAPLAHLAVYKVCGPSVCSEHNILAAMDVAIDDGVDILSISLGAGSKPFDSDNIAQGAYSAVEKGIFVSCSAGNDGPLYGTLSNEAPWILTVGASTIDRKIVASAILGNQEEFEGQSLYQPMDFPSSQFPLIYPGMNVSNLNASFCIANALDNAIEFQGKIVVCETGGGITTFMKGQNVKAVGGVGMIMINSVIRGSTIPAEAHVLPVTHLSYIDGQKVVAYINSASLPTASIVFKGTIIGESNAPAVAYFSSRGPNRASPGILKPDIIGPGVNILAAWPTSIENNSNTHSTFNIISGTSMSCPHLSGVAALIKSVHPDWSPAAIKSAIMTTADHNNLANIPTPIQDETLFQANFYAVGSGHVNVTKASDPGLVYDIKTEDYVHYLCGLGYTDLQVGTILKRRVNCLTELSIMEAQLNYPSFSITFGSIIQTYTRTVTNVGDPNSVYVVGIVAPDGISVIVKPDTLMFSEQNRILTYEVTFVQLATAKNNTVNWGYLTWYSGKYYVISPIAATILNT